MEGICAAVIMVIVDRRLAEWEERGVEWRDENAL